MQGCPIFCVKGLGAIVVIECCAWDGEIVGSDYAPGMLDLEQFRQFQGQYSLEPRLLSLRPIVNFLEIFNE